MKKISKRVREEAIELLEFVAAVEVACGCTAIVDLHAGDGGLDSAEVYELALIAWTEVFGEIGDDDDGATYLEAAALLRDGWCPCEPVEVRS